MRWCTLDKVSYFLCTLCFDYSIKNIAQVVAPVINALTRSDERTGVISFTDAQSEQDAGDFQYEIIFYAVANRSVFNEVR